MLHFILQGTQWKRFFAIRRLYIKQSKGSERLWGSALPLSIIWWCNYTWQSGTLGSPYTPWYNTTLHDWTSPSPLHPSVWVHSVTQPPPNPHTSCRPWGVSVPGDTAASELWQLWLCGLWWSNTSGGKLPVEWHDGAKQQYRYNW